MHCCIKCPQILREKTSSQNSQGIALRIQRYFFSSKLDGIKKYFCRQYLQNLNALIFWFKYLQKVNAMPSDFWWKKKSFAPLTNNFWSFKKREKNIYQCKKKNLSFSSEIWGHFAFTFCRYLNQNMRAFTFCRYCPPIVFCPQIWKTKRTQKSRAITLNFWDEVFSLSMPSVCPRLTTV